MLYYLFNYLNKIDFPGAGVFEYISFRAAMAVIVSLVISMIFGKKIIQRLQLLQDFLFVHYYGSSRICTYLHRIKFALELRREFSSW